MTCKEYPSPIGTLVLGAENGALVRLCLPGTAPEGLDDGQDPVLEAACAGLDAYFSGRSVMGELPLRLHGTPFQQKVWKLLKEIPRGEVRTYGQLAQKLGCPGGARAVGMACHRNPIPILIPCHRVVGRGGTLTGYAGGLEQKRRLLELEGVVL